MQSRGSELRALIDVGSLGPRRRQITLNSESVCTRVKETWLAEIPRR